MVLISSNKHFSFAITINLGIPRTALYEIYPRSQYCTLSQKRKKKTNKRRNKKTTFHFEKQKNKRLAIKKELIII